MSTEKDKEIGQIYGVRSVSNLGHLLGKEEGTLIQGKHQPPVPDFLPSLKLRKEGFSPEGRLGWISKYPEKVKVKASSPKSLTCNENFDPRNKDCLDFNSDSIFFVRLFSEE